VTQLPGKPRPAGVRKNSALREPPPHSNVRAVLEPHRTIAALALLVGCSDATGGTPHGGAATSVLSDSGALHLTLRASPEDVPVRGNNQLALDVRRADSEEPVEGLSLSMVPFMPAMGHGSSVVPRCSEQGGGHYRCDDVVLAMPGLWELRTTFGGTASDSVVFRFDVD